MSVFFLFSIFMQNFKLTAIPDQPKPSTRPVDGFTTAPQPFEAILTPRL